MQSDPVIFLIACAIQIWFNRYSAAVYQREHARRDPVGDDPIAKAR